MIKNLRRKKYHFNMPHPPLPPHLEHPKPIGPDHQLPSGNNHKIKVILAALLIATLVALVIGVVLHFVGVKIDVILPVLAPIWVGAITLVYTTNLHR